MTKLITAIQELAFGKHLNNPCTYNVNMDFETVTNTILIGLGLFLMIRLFFISFVAKRLQQKLLFDKYMDILNSPQYQVKGKFE